MSRMYFNDKGNLVDSNLLMKISKIQYLEDIQNGKLFMNKTSFYRNYETEGLGDNKECLVSEFKPDILTVGDVKIQGCKNVSIFTHDYPVFCITSIPLTKETENRYTYTIDNRLLTDFTENQKEYGVILISKDAFVQRVKEKMTQLGCQWYWDKITYTDEVESFPKNENFKVAFRKRAEFSYQSEWRLMIWEDVEKYYELFIEDLKDCSQIIKLSDLSKNPKIEVMCNA